LNEVGKEYRKQNNRFNIVTSAPSLIGALKKSKEWACISYGRNKAHKGNVTSGSENRITASFELK
jgi:hypothetical protein